MSKANDLKPYVRAEIVDIQKPDCVVEKCKMLVDTNVLYFFYYDRISLLASIGEGARDYQLREYAAFFRKLLSSGIELFVHKVCLCELAHRIELAEQKILFCEKRGLNRFNDKDFKIKEMRRKYSKEFESIKTRLMIYLHSISKTFKLIHFDIPVGVFLHSFLFEWKDTVSGAGDSMMIAEAKHEGINSVLSDDSDFASFNNIKLYTANNIAISAHEMLKAEKTYNKA